MLGWRSSGLRPAPSAGTGLTSANGLARNTVRAAKKPARASSTAVA